MSSTDSPSREKMQDEDWQQASQAKKQVFGLSFPQWVLFLFSLRLAHLPSFSLPSSPSLMTHTHKHTPRWSQDWLVEI